MEETNELDDDELNELLARGDNELEIFAQMDRDRVANQNAEWKASGKPGPLPPPLMEESELPPFYRRDIGQEMAEAVVNDEDQGRGRRAKAQVQYTDGLTDDQFINALEDSDDDVMEAAERKKLRTEKKAERKRVNEALAAAEAEGKPLGLIKIKQLKEESEGPSSAGSPGAPPKKKRGRPARSITPSVQDDDFGPSVCDVLVEVDMSLMKLQVKKRKTVANDETSIMNRLYTSTNALTTETGELCNTYFTKPVDRKVCTVWLFDVERFPDPFLYRYTQTITL